jgi:surfeit locus 1 family protein
VKSPIATPHVGIIEATLVAFLGIGILVGLGVWQIDRKLWKEDLIAKLNDRLTKHPESLPSRGDWPQLKQANDEFRRVSFQATFLPAKAALVYTAGSALRPDVQGAGYWVFSPARLDNGSVIAINRGFLPFEHKDDAARPPSGAGAINVVGVMRWPEKPGLFTPAADPKGNIWYLRDPAAMAAANGWNVTAPFYIDQEGPVPPNGGPKPGQLKVNLPNNHLQYAITWFGLALGLAGVYLAWLIGGIKKRRSASL